MNYLVNPSSQLRGELTVPGDKSISHRALMFSSIADGTSTISDILTGEDCLATLTALRALGVEIEQAGPTTVRVTGSGMDGLQEPAQALDMGNSGTAMRLFSGLLAGQQFSSRLVGDESLSKRPMIRVTTPLTAMGAHIESNNGTPPLAIRGGATLRAVDYPMPVASAQVKSAILLAGLYADGETRITEPAISRDHSERMLQSMGVSVGRDDGVISISGGQRLRAFDAQVPADLSSAAFIILATLIAEDGDVLLKNVGVNPSRMGVIDVLLQMGADITLHGQRQSGAEPVADIRVRSSMLTGVAVHKTLVSLAIDEFPVLFVAAAVAQGRTSFSGISELRVKESDRITAMATGLTVLGIEVSESEDAAEIQGGSLGGGTVESFGDHRVAMALAVAGTAAGAPVTVTDTANVDTSFPGFVTCARQVGLDIGQIEAAT